MFSSLLEKQGEGFENVTKLGSTKEIPKRLSVTSKGKDSQTVLINSEICTSVKFQPLLKQFSKQWNWIQFGIITLLSVPLNCKCHCSIERLHISSSPSAMSRIQFELYTVIKLIMFNEQCGFFIPTTHFVLMRINFHLRPPPFVRYAERLPENLLSDNHRNHKRTEEHVRNF